jgi:hypothetical protein
LDKLRDIIFGNQMAETEKSFNPLEEHLDKKCPKLPDCTNNTSILGYFRLKISVNS